VRYCGRCTKCLSEKVYQCARPETCLRDKDESPRMTMDGAPVTQAFGLGGFAEQALVHENQLVKVPNEVPFA
jgi:S-(hydroxymethyl)glutathione dehydrogenase/alcohol dehydrogenase